MESLYWKELTTRGIALGSLCCAVSEDRTGESTTFYGVPFAELRRVEVLHTGATRGCQLTLRDRVECRRPCSRLSPIHKADAQRAVPPRMVAYQLLLSYMLAIAFDIAVCSSSHL